MPADRLWTGTDEEEKFSPWIALPGRGNLGMGRHWHFFSIIFWVLNGVIYIALLFATGEWTRLIPTSWSIFPAAGRTAWIYLHLHLPPPGNPYNPLQQLAYAGVVFLLAPFAIATGAAMSPAIAGRFPWYLRLFGGRQSARSLHFLALLAFIGFTVVHVALVIIEDFSRNMDYIIHGQRGAAAALAVEIGLWGLVAAFLIYVWATRISLRAPRWVQHALGAVVEPVRHTLLHHLTSRQHYRESDISPYFRVNGAPPDSPEFVALARAEFRDWRLPVSGLVEHPLQLSLADLRAMPAETQITKHNCIQGWSAVGMWIGVPLAHILELCKPLPSARYMVFWSYGEGIRGGTYYETIDLELARHPQTMLAYEMNGASIPLEHGAPCRLRVETQLGFKMVKYLRSIELVEDYRSVGQGQGGYREDVQYYGPNAGI